MKKIKYLGVCASALLTIAPISANAITFASQSVTSVVKAASDYQDSLDNAFSSTVNVAVGDIANLKENEFGGDYSSGNGNIVYKNAATSGSLFGTGNSSPYEKLSNVIKQPLLKLFIKGDPIVGYLSNKNYRTTMNVSGSKITPATGPADIIHQLQTLSVGSSFKVTLTTRDIAGDIKGTKVINATIVNDPTKSSLASIAPLQVENGTTTASTEQAYDNAAVIKNSEGKQIFTASDLNSALNNGKYYYQSTVKNSGGSDPDITFDKTSYGLNGNNKVTIYNQYIPVPYTTEIAKKYDASNFVFLKPKTGTGNEKKAEKNTDAVQPGSNQVAYVVRKVVVGNVVEKDYPIFRYQSTDSNGTTTIATIKNGSTLTPNKVDSPKLVYTYNNQASLSTLKSYLENDFKNSANGAGNFKAYKNSDASGELEISFAMPPVNATTASQFVLAKAVNPDTGVESTVKIPVTVKGIPNSYNPPTITKFPDNNQVSVNSKSTTKLDAKSLVAATYIDASGTKQNLSASNIDVSVKNSNNDDIVLNSDGTIPTTTPGTYKVHYVFANPNDTSKTVAKDLTLVVTSGDLQAPTVTGFTDNGIYTLSNNKQKEVSPLAPVLGMSDVKATYIGSDGATHTIENSKISYKITNKSGQDVALNSNGTIPMTKADTYTIKYVWTNPDDPTKTVTKTSTLIVNSIISQPITAKYSGNEVANPTVDEGTTFNVLNNLSFNLVYTDPSTSTPTTPITETVPNNFISVSVTKNGKKVDLDSNSFTTTEGTYDITYQITNPKDNVTVLNYSRSLTVKKSKTEPTLENANGVVWVNYVPGYGINLWKTASVTGGAELLSDGTFRKLQHGTAWKYSQIATYPDGSKWYKLGTNQWIPAQYASTKEISTGNSWNIRDAQGVGVVNYVPGYGINVWTTPDQQTFIKKLAHGTAWRYFKVATKNGSTMYNLGGNQWVDSIYFVPSN